MKGNLDCPCCGLPLCQSIKWIAESIERDLKVEIGETYELHITSGARCEKHNAAVSGSKNSAHIKRIALDVRFGSSRELYLLIKSILNKGIKRVGVNFQKGFIHFDTATGLVPHPRDGLKEYPQEIIFSY